MGIAIINKQLYLYFDGYITGSISSVGQYRA